MIRKIECQLTRDQYLALESHELFKVRQWPNELYTTILEKGTLERYEGRTRFMTLQNYQYIKASCHPNHTFLMETPLDSDNDSPIMFRAEFPTGSGSVSQALVAAQMLQEANIEQVEVWQSVTEGEDVYIDFFGGSSKSMKPAELVEQLVMTKALLERYRRLVAETGRRFREQMNGEKILDAIRQSWE